MLRRCGFFAIFAMVMAVGTTGAWAQAPGSFSHDTSLPIDVTADELEVREEGNAAIFRGEVEAVQGDLILKAAEIRVYYRSRDEDGQIITRIDANGNVVIQTPDESAKGDWAIYDVDQEIVTLGGDVEVERAGNMVSARRLVVDLSSGQTRMEGAGAEGERVRGTFRPSEGGADSGTDSGANSGTDSGANSGANSGENGE